MSNDISSRDKWRNKANFDKATTDAVRAQQQNITIEELAKKDEAERLAKLPDPVEPENQEAISHHVALIAEQEKEIARMWEEGTLSPNAELDTIEDEIALLEHYVDGNQGIIDELSELHDSVEPEEKEQNPEKTYDWKEEWRNSEIDNSPTEISRMDQGLEANRDSFKEAYDPENAPHDYSNEEQSSLYDRGKGIEGKQVDYKSDVKESQSKTTETNVSKSSGFEPGI